MDIRYHLEIPMEVKLRWPMQFASSIMVNPFTLKGIICNRQIYYGVGASQSC